MVRIAQLDQQLNQLNKQIALQDQSIGLLNANLTALYSSGSWRITRPLRGLSRLARGDVGHVTGPIQRQIRRMRTLARVLPKAINVGGGARGTVHTTWIVLRREGWYGVKRRLVQVAGNKRG